MLPRLLTAASLLLTLVACGSVPGPGPLPGPPDPQSGPAATPARPASSFAQRVLDLTNAARVQARDCGTVHHAAASPLTYNARLEQAAQAHAADMAARNYFSHTSQDGRTFAQRISGSAYIWSVVAENIAAGQTSPEEVVAGWLGSPGHCENVMDPALRELGVGYTPASSGTYRTYWVQDFGAPR